MTKTFTNIYTANGKLLLLFFLFFSLYAQSQDSLATVYFYRASKFAGSFVGYDIKLGDQLVGRIKSGSVITYRGKPGEPIFSARTESESSFRVILEAGKIYYVECGISVGVVAGRPTFREVSSAEARKEIGAIDPTVANSIPASAERVLHPNDTVRALHNLFQRKRKGATVRGSVFGVIGLISLISTTKTSTVSAPNGQSIDVTPSPTGAYLVAGFSGLMLVTAVVQNGNYSSSKLNALVDNYRKGVALPQKIKLKLKAKDFE